MKHYERVMPVENASSLDNLFRRWIQNSNRILHNRVREGMAVLELGCGSGFFTLEIARLVGRSGKVIAADLQDGMLELLSRKIGGTGMEDRIQLHKCSEDGIGVLEKVDLVLAFFMVHEVADKRRFLKEIKSIMKPDGRLYIIEFKAHPPKAKFDEMVEIAYSLGFKEMERPGFLLSRAVIFK